MVRVLTESAVIVAAQSPLAPDAYMTQAVVVSEVAEPGAVHPDDGQTTTVSALVDALTSELTVDLEQTKEEYRDVCRAFVAKKRLEAKILGDDFMSIFHDVLLEEAFLPTGDQAVSRGATRSLGAPFPMHSIMQVIGTCCGSCYTPVETGHVARPWPMP